MRGVKSVNEDEDEDMTPLTSLLLDRSDGKVYSVSIDVVLYIPPEPLPSRQKGVNSIEGMLMFDSCDGD